MEVRRQDLHGGQGLPWYQPPDLWLEGRSERGLMRRDLARPWTRISLLDSSPKDSVSGEHLIMESKVANFPGKGSS